MSGLTSSRRAAKLAEIADPSRALIAAAYRDAPAVSLDRTAGAGLPEGVPPLPQVRWTSAEVKAAQARVAELAAQTEGFEGRLAAAYDAGDADAVLGVRRESEEVSVRLWAARRDAMTAERTHLEAEAARVVGFLQAYSDPLDVVRATIRELHGQERQLFDALSYVEGALARIANATERLDGEAARLARGPVELAAAVAKKEGWRP